MDKIDEAGKQSKRPGDRLGDIFTPGKQGDYQEARNRPDKPTDLEAAPATEAKRDEYKPAGIGMQVTPSPGGGNYFNPRAFKPEQTNQKENQPEPQAQAPPRQSLFDAAQQRLNEAKATKALSRESLETTRPILRMAHQIGHER